MKCINYLSLLWFSPQFQLGGGGEVNNGAHLFQSTVDIDFKTHTKHAKMYEMYKLFIFAAVLFAATKLRRLAICIINKFKYKNSNTHASMDGPPHPDMFGGGGESFKMAALLSEWCERLWNWATTVDTCHVLHLHTNTIGISVNVTLLTYLLNSENFIICTNLTFATETHPW